MYRYDISKKDTCADLWGGVSINSIFFQNNSKTPVCLVESILYYLNVHVLTFTFLDMLTLIGYDSDQRLYLNIEQGIYLLS